MTDSLHRRRMSSTLGSVFKASFAAGLDFLFPKEPVVATLEHTPSEKLIELLTPSDPCPPPSSVLENIYTLFAYADERVKHLVWEIKYQKNTHIAEHVGQILSERILRTIPIPLRDEHWHVIPVPLTNRRLKERGFHHTRLIATSVLKFLPPHFVLADSTLAKTRHTPKQSSLADRSERLTNLRGAFAVTNPAAINENNIIVIDDVVTTGSTLQEIASVLSHAGAKQIYCFAIAH